MYNLSRAILGNCQRIEIIRELRTELFTELRLSKMQVTELLLSLQNYYEFICIYMHSENRK